MSKNFDENGNELDETVYDEKGHLELKFISDLSKDKTIIKSQYGSNGDLLGKLIFKYDAKGNLIECGTYRDGAPTSPLKIPEFKILFKYDDKNNRVEVDGTGSVFSQKEIFIYNNNNQIIKENSTENSQNGVEKASIILNYDLGGNQIKYETHYPDGKLKNEHIILYSNFDDNGNWRIVTSETKIHNKLQNNYLKKAITKREIEYFK